MPKAIRQALGVSYGGRVIFRFEDGTVTLHAAAESTEDPALAPFLTLLERDMAARPEALVLLTPDLAARMAAATEGVNPDPDAPIDGYSAAARIGTCACKNRRTRSIVRCFSSAGSFHGYTVISAFGASDATSIDVCSGCDGTSSGSTSIGVRQFAINSRDTLYRKSG